MAGYEAHTNTPTDRAVNTVLSNHMKKVEVDVLRQRKLSAMIMKRGNVVYNDRGNGFTWPVQYRNHDAESTDGAQVRNFTPQNLWQKASLEHRGVEVTDAITKKEYLAGRAGRTQIVAVWDNVVTRLKKSLTEAMAPIFYIDGNATGNLDLPHGIESMMGHSANNDVPYTWNYLTGESQAATNEDYIAVPDDSYGGLDTDLAAYGGAQQSGVFPFGVADPQYDFWTPILVNTNSIRFGTIASNKTGWQSNAPRILRFGIINVNRNVSLDGQMDVILLDREMYFDFENLEEAKERIQVQKELSLKSFGFGDVINIDGTEVTQEYGIPRTNLDQGSGTAADYPVAYGFATSLMTIRSMQGQMFGVEGPEEDIDTGTRKVVVDFLGNNCFESPRNFVKFCPYSPTDS